LTDTAVALLGSVLTTLFAAIVVLAVAITKTRERVVRLEEWARLHERKDRERDGRETRPS